MQMVCQTVFKAGARNDYIKFGSGYALPCGIESHG